MATVKEIKKTIKAHQYVSDSISYILSKHINMFPIRYHISYPPKTETVMKNATRLLV